DIGCFFMGFFVYVNSKAKMYVILYTLLTTGMCGSITSFSSWQVGAFNTIFGLGNNNIPVILKVFAPISDTILTMSVSFGSFFFGKHIGEFYIFLKNDRKEKNLEHSSTRALENNTGLQENITDPSDTTRLQTEEKFNRTPEPLISSYEPSENANFEEEVPRKTRQSHLYEAETNGLEPNSNIRNSTTNNVFIQDGEGVSYTTFLPRNQQMDVPRSHIDMSHFETKSDNFKHTKLFTNILSILGWGLFVTCVTFTGIKLSSNIKNVTNFDKLIVALAFGPPGAVLRWKLSSLNGKYKSVPAGTLTANLLAVLILSVATGIRMTFPIKKSVCLLLNFGIGTGFCGCLSTISTFINELSSFPKAKSYKYFFISVIPSQIMIMTVYLLFNININFGNYSFNC
ncbi:hypothetical protein BB558_000419, partial [Smittium angustum]